MKARPSELIAPRDRELRSLALALTASGQASGWHQAWQMAVDMPASRWWISEERAAQAIGLWLRRSPDAPPPATCREHLYADLCALYIEARSTDPELSVSAFAREVVYTPAPCHYLLADTARRSAAQTHRNDVKNNHTLTPARRRNAMRRPRHHRG